MKVTDLRPDLGFGARITGVDKAALEDPQLRAELAELFDRRGLLLFDEVEASAAMLVAVSNIIGPLKEHPVPTMTRTDGENLPGVIEFSQRPDNGDIVEIDGQRLLHWLPWHFDHCYNDQLNRGAALRALDIAPEGGLTGFVDGIELYRALPNDLRRAADQHKVIYRLNLINADMRFGLPADFKAISSSGDSRAATAHSAKMPRSIHPMVWTRDNGEKVLHLTAWMAQGIEGREDASGDALLEELCQAINRLAPPIAYHHQWRPDQIVAWDNWRLLHSVGGCPDSHVRTMQRTTILGDYGLGLFETTA
jgi:taurine dioxygenase